MKAATPVAHKGPIVLLTILLVAWSVFIPVFEGADESGHYCHAEYIAKNKKLPNFNVIDGCFLAYPPGYYLLVAPLVAMNPAANFDEKQIQSNPAYISNRKGKDIFSKYVHPRSELAFEWNPLLQTVHLMRLLSVVMGLGIIILTIKAAELISPFRWLPSASIILFFNPMFLHMFSVISNVTLVSFLAAVFIYVHLKQEAKGSSKKLAWFQGVILGLGVISKINMLSLVLGYVPVIVSSGWSLKAKVRHALMTGLGFAVSAGWYIFRTLKLYGEPFEINIASSFRGESMTRMQEMGLVNYWSSFPDTLFRTFWSGYGLNKVWLPELVIVGVLTVTLFMLWGFFSQYRQLPRLLNVACYYLIAVLVGHMVINVKTEAFHAKDIFTAYLPLALCSGVGLKALARRLSRKKVFFHRLGVIAIGTIVFIFYAKFELVRLVKVGLGLLRLSGFYAPESMSLFPIWISLIWKAGIVGLFIWGLLRIVRLMKPTLIVWRNVIVVASLANLLILGYSSYLFYSRFL